MKIFFVILLFFSITLLASEDAYVFKNPSQQQQFEFLTTQLRCLVCQNQNIAESNAPLAADLREQVYQRIQQNQSNKQIINYLVARYGDFILYNPPLTILTIGLWFGPLIILLMGLGYLFYYIKKSKQNYTAPSRDYK